MSILSQPAAARCQGHHLLQPAALRCCSTSEGTFLPLFGTQSYLALNQEGHPLMRKLRRRGSRQWSSPHDASQSLPDKKLPERETKFKQLNWGFPAKAVFCNPLCHFTWVTVSLHPQNVTEHSQTQDESFIRQAGASVWRYTVMPYTQEAPAHLYWMLKSTQQPTGMSGRFGNRTHHSPSFFHLLLPC